MARSTICKKKESYEENQLTLKFSDHYIKTSTDSLPSESRIPGCCAMKLKYKVSIENLVYFNAVAIAFQKYG